MNWGYNAPRRRRYHRFWDSSKLAQAIREQKEKGTDYLVQKYGQHRVNQISAAIEKAHATPGRGKTGGTVGYGKFKGRKIGDASKNGPSAVRAGDWLSGNKVGNSYARVGFRDGGPNEIPKDENGVPFKPGDFKPRVKMNLENDEELAQGYQHAGAQTTSISSTITGLLRQAQNSAPNFWDQFFADKPGQYALDSRGSSSIGVDARYTSDPAPSTQGQLGAFGMPAGFPQAGQAATNPNFCAICKSPGHSTAGHTAANDIRNPANPQPPATTPPATTPPATPPAPTGPPTSNDPSSPDYVPPPYNPDSDPILGAPKTNSGPLYNPWAFGEGGDANAYGPSQQYMGNATMQAMALANAYFAPQRMELAYELGDMETDMRRLAVNLGRQVDDPVLQAKLYKEATQAVRTLDVQQNTFAFQMAEQRRREELQNFQYYDNLAQQEYQTYLQNRLNEGQLELSGRVYGLNRWSIMHPPTAPTGGGTVNPTSPAPTVPTSSPMQQPGQLAQGQFGIPAQQPGQLSQLGGSLLNMPTATSMGGATVVRSRYSR